MFRNLILKSDFPDPDVIRVEDTYYMISTTMHFMPGGVILRSYDLLNWEIASYVFDCLETNPAHNLEDGKNIYGQGMWAASIRHREDCFYVCFTANDTQKTYLFTSKSMDGPWDRREIEGFYHDNSLLLEADGRNFIVYGNTQIYLTELDADFKGPKPGGIHRMIIEEKGDVGLGYEGAHIYKINGRYYVFLIHWTKTGHQRRTQACFVAEDLEGDFIGRDILDTDIGYCNQGVAQGGLIETKDGDWYAMLFQDRGAVGRIPVLVGVTFDDGFPKMHIGKKSLEKIKLNDVDYTYESVVTSDDFHYIPDKAGAVQLKPQWQWNHNPDPKLWSVTKVSGQLRIQTNRLCKNVTQAINSLTQRTLFPETTVSVTLEGKDLNIGDYIFLSGFQSGYSGIGMTKSVAGYHLIHINKSGEPSPMGQFRDDAPGIITEQIQLKDSRVTVRLRANFEAMKDEIQYYYKQEEQFIPFGSATQHRFTLDHFTGCRVALVMMSTQHVGGEGAFEDFRYEV